MKCEKWICMEESVIKRTVKKATSWRCPTPPCHIVFSKKNTQKNTGTDFFSKLTGSGIATAETKNTIVAWNQSPQIHKNAYENSWPEFSIKRIHYQNSATPSFKTVRMLKARAYKSTVEDWSKPLYIVFLQLSEFVTRIQQYHLTAKLPGWVYKYGKA